MKTKRTFASLCLALSCCALIAASNVSVGGDQPGVVRLTSGQEPFAPAPVPPAGEQLAPAPIPDSGFQDAYGQGAPPVYTDQGAPFYEPMTEGYPVESGMPMMPQDFSPYFESSGVTEAPVLGRRPQENPLFGPQLMFETNIDNGLGFNEAYHRANARIPYHVVPGNSVLIGDLSASMTNNGTDLYNFGLVWRNYDAMRNRVFGWNAFFDMDDGRGNATWKRVGFGIESLGKYLDFRANGYFVQGEDSRLINDSLNGDLALAGNNVFRIRNQTRDNAYSGADVEVGGPVPYLGRRGINTYIGGYYLDNDMGHETVGFSSRIEALVTESASVNVHYTNDDTFGANSWVSIAYTIPNYGERKIFQPRNVRDRLADPVVRSSRIHSNIDMVDVPEAVINDKTGAAYNISYVDPNATVTGTGTFEDPYGTLQLAATNNNAAIDIIRVAPNADDSGTDLTVNGGLSLFECQALISSVKDYTLFVEDNVPFVIPAAATATNLGPLISNPTMGVGDSVVQVTNGNTVFGMRIDGANAAGTVFGTGISNALPLEDINISCNVFTNYTNAVDLQNVSGTVIMEDNTATGLSGVSEGGLVLTTANGSLTNLLVQNNTVDNNSVTGISITAGPNSTLNADNPNGVGAVVGASVQATGIVGNTAANGGDGIVVTSMVGANVNAIVDDNVAFSNSRNGFIGRADGGTFNLASLRNNRLGGEDINGDGILAVSEDLNNNGVLDVGEDVDGDGVLDLGEDVDGDGVLAGGNGENGALLHYLNGGNFFARTEDVNEDLNFNGVLDLGEDLDGDNILDVADGLLGTGEDLNSNGRLDQGIVSNILTNNVTSGLCILGDGSGLGEFVIGGPDATLGNQIVSNLNAGVAVDLRGTATARIDSLFNTIQNTGGTGIASTTLSALFSATGNTNGAPFTIVNNSVTADITDFSVDLVSIFEFDTSTGLFGSGGNFAPLNSTEDLTGLQTVNGIPVPPFDNTNGLATALGGSQTLSLTFADDAVGLTGFDSADRLEYTLDVDLIGGVSFLGADVPVIANELAGSVASVTFRDNFDGSALPGSSITLAGVLSQSATDPAGFEVVFNETVQRNTFSVDSTVLGNGTVVSVADASRLLSFNSINDTIGLNKGDGLSVIASGTSTVDALTIQGATIEQSGGRGLNIEARDSAMITASSTIGGFDTTTSGLNIIGGLTFSEGNTIRNNESDGVRILAADSGVVSGNLINNTITGNLGDGVIMVVEDGGTLDFGDTANNEMITRNTISGNSGVGILMVSDVTAGATGVINAIVQSNTISQNASGGILAEAFGTSPDNFVNLTVGGTADDANTIDQNSGTGIGFNVAGNARGVLNLSNSVVTNTTANGTDSGDGVSLTRADSSLLTATIDTVTATGNAGDGLNLDVQGNDKTDPNQPMSGTVSTVDWTNNNFSNNGENGAQFRVRGDAQLIADGTNNVVSNNTLNGILVQTSENSSFGDPTVGLPPFRRVIFDGIVAEGNGQDGLNILATEDSRAMVQVTSTRIAGSTDAHAALNTNGDSSFSNNGRDGIRITTTGGRSDIDITSDTGSTTISGNGTVAGGNGIRWDASGTADATVRVTSTSITGNLVGATEAVALNGNGILDPGEDINGNGILDTGEDGSNDDVDVADGDGIQYNVFGTATSTLIVGGAVAGDGNLIQSNGDDGIAISATGVGSRPVISVVGNTIGGSRDGIAAGNGGDGVSLNVLGQTAAAGNASGPIVQMVLTDNQITNNSQRGANLLLTGAAGERDRENFNSDFDPVRITLTGNTIASNGTEGIFFRGDSEMNQGRFTLLGNTGFPGDDRSRLFPLYDPNQIQFLSDNFGSVNGNTAFASEAADGAVAYLNLRTVQNTFLSVVGNTVQNNGVATVTGEGLVLSVGTGSYLAADVRDNVFGGNLEQDVRTESFLSFGNTATSIDTSGVGSVDTIFHDDSAQLDMRFLDNTGNQILLSSDGATYTNFDNLKVITQGGGVVDRDAAFFQVDDGGNLDNPNNTFINFGITQDIDGAFISGGFNLRGAADALFPNIGFAPFLP